MNKEHETPLEKVIEIEEKVLKRFSRSRKSALERYPFLFLILTTIGTILTLTGLQKLIAEIDWLITNPLLMLTLGLGFLVVTGALYKKLG